MQDHEIGKRDAFAKLKPMEYFLRIGLCTSLVIKYDFPSIEKPWLEGQGTKRSCYYANTLHWLLATINGFIAGTNTLKLAWYLQPFKSEVKNRFGERENI